MSDTAKPKSPRKRRNRHRYRRRTAGRGTSASDESNVPVIAEPKPEPFPQAADASSLPTVHEGKRPKPKLNPKFLLEEREVRASLERLSTASVGGADGKPKLHQIDKEILFFTDALPEEQFFDAEEHPHDSVSPSNDNVLPKPPSGSQRSSLSNDTDVQTRLASSYLRTDEGNPVVVPWKVQKYEGIDEDLMYYVPSSTISFGRTVLKEVCVIDPQDDHEEKPHAKKPIFPPPKGVSEANKNRFINRLLEEEQEEWFDASGDLANFRQYILGPERWRGFCSKTFVPYFVEPIPMDQPVEQLPMDRTVRILIGVLRFDAHPSFQEAVRLRLRLEKLYKQYYRLRVLNRKEMLQSKLDELRTKALRRNHEDEQDAFQLKMARRDLRKLIYQEVRTERQLAAQIIELWEEMNAKQLILGLKMTAINRQDTEEERYASELQKRFDLELRETLEEEQEIYLRERQEYKAYVRDLALHHQSDGETNGHVRPAVQKPKKPDIARVRQEFRNHFDQAFRSPSEQLIKVILQRDPEYDSAIEHKEHTGKDLTFKIKLFIDGKHVASTKARHFHGDSRTIVDFNTSFSVKLTTKIPENISLNLFEKNRLGIKAKRAEIFVPLPGSDELYEEIVPQDYQFSYGKPYKIQSYANGTVELKVGWIEPADGSGSFPDPIQRRTVPRRVVIPRELVRQWIDDRALDSASGECDVNPELLQALRDEEPDNKQPEEQQESAKDAQSDAEPPEQQQQDSDEFFFNEELLAFCSQETIDQNERFQMLRKRFNSSSLRFRDARFIPQSVRELAFEGQEDDEENKIIDETLGTDPIDLQRHRAKRHLQQVYDIISNHCRMLNQDKVNNSNLLVGGNFVPSFRSLSTAFLEMFGPRRPLKPSRRSPNVRTSVRLSEVTQFKIIVTIVRAFGIPMRTEDYQSMVSAGRRNSNMSSTNGRFSFRTSNVRPYMTVSLKDRVLRTSTADGTAPTWNEQLELPLDCTTDQIRKHLHIDLYDEYMEDLLEDDRTRPTELYQRISSRWLGQLRIPISTIYLNQRLEGTFEVKTPPILFGYDRQQQGQAASDIPESYGLTIGTIGSASGLPDLRELTHVSLFISLEPLIDKSMLDTSGLECVEQEPIKTRIYLWYDEYRHEFPARAVVPPMVTLLNGKRVCATRLLGPLPIPFAIDETAEMMIRRYVSLIPVHYSIDPCSQLSGLWLTNTEVLSMMCASAKDLGVLLACFYLQLGYDVWLIFGNSVLMGDTTFVLLLEGGEFFIVDPCSGKKYSSTDTYCPLNRIYLVVNQGNVWGNIQKETRVFLSQLDVRKSGYWRALFNRFHEPPEGCVQEDTFTYSSALPVKELQRAIERKLMRKISTWRTHRKTVWNRFISDHLRSTLISLERDACLEVNTERYADEFAQMFVSYKVNGFPINLPYSNLSSIVAQVKGTGIHLNSEAGVEFALGVFIKDYPCNVYSVWIFLMSLVPRM